MFTTGVKQPYILRPLDEVPGWGIEIGPHLPMLTIQILVGVIGGGSGWGYTGGGHPVPIDPEPFRHLEPGARDALVALAIDQLARSIRDPGSRALVRMGALTSIEQTIARLKATLGSEAQGLNPSA